MKSEKTEDRKSWKNLITKNDSENSQEKQINLELAWGKLCDDYPCWKESFQSGFLPCFDRQKRVC